MKEKLLQEATAAESQEKAQLQDLVEVAMGLKERKAPVPEQPEAIEHITTRQIKTMRQVSAQQINQKEPLGDRLMQGAIRMYFSVAGMFSVPEDKTKKNHCAINGHQCAKCGQKFAVDAVKPVDPIKAVDER